MERVHGRTPPPDSRRERYEAWDSGPMHQPSLHGRRFRVCGASPGSEVDDRTTFEYGERDGQVWAAYSGGNIRRGFLVGTRDGDWLDFRYVQLGADGHTSSGHCRSTVTALADGRLRLDEVWQWESKSGAGESACEEIPRS